MDIAVTVFSVVPEYGDPPDESLVAADLHRMLEGRLDVEDRLERRARNARPLGAAAPPPKVTLVDGASQTATVVEVRAHDEPGLLWRIGRALGDCGLNVRAARVETLGAEAVDVFYVTDSAGGQLTDPELRKRTVASVLAALTPALSTAPLSSIYRALELALRLCSRAHSRAHQGRRLPLVAPRSSFQTPPRP
jgi:[protein-PII] uridylyltransferase